MLLRRRGPSGGFWRARLCLLAGGGLWGRSIRRGILDVVSCDWNNLICFLLGGRERVRYSLADCAAFGYAQIAVY